MMIYEDGALPGNGKHFIGDPQVSLNKENLRFKCFVLVSNHSEKQILLNMLN